MRIREPRIDRGFHVINYCILALFALSVVYPLVYVVSSSLSSAEAISTGAVKLFPVGFNVDAYQTIFAAPPLLRGMANSIFYAVAGAVIGTVLTVLCAYPLSRPDLPGRRWLTFFVLIPTLFSAGIIPNYIVVQQLGLLNTVWAIVLPGAMAVFNVIITRTFYQLNIPGELLEAAKIDGASDAQFFLRVALPLSKPIIAVNLLFYAVGQWNGWFSAMLYLTDQNLYPLQLVLREVLTLASVSPTDMGSMSAAEFARRQDLFDKLRYALIVVAMIPPLIAYPFVQRHFVKGALIGSLK
ncbi:carbohydrate ABC transporter permease [Microlunatus parietis]|uniref:Multiple sugar transport system permease protein/putative aldouronate transport system permease protein n=1 Tax=Microlunatus parietis TaxID=682979 RepID=A0A7Y9IG30_9ACTN|nr:carbohydrate ABC transporter permease [Microlunatus parietis]NYE75574.1 multiple sugar transport system permease protein/putative aldouronate transport system permease protein [Microlunatus parietis]